MDRAGVLEGAKAKKLVIFLKKKRKRKPKLMFILFVNGAEKKIVEEVVRNDSLFHAR